MPSNVRGDNRANILGFDANYSYNPAEWNYMYGGFGNDELHSGAGRDVIYGEGDDDWILVADDRVMDIFDGGSGKDTIDYWYATAGVEVHLSNVDSVGRSFGGGAAQSDIFIGIENVSGSNYTDWLTPGIDGYAWGKGGVDYLYGNANSSRDILIGGSGADHLYMATDASDPGTIAWLENGGGWADVIHGFAEGLDRLLIRPQDWYFGSTFTSSELKNNLSGRAEGGAYAQFIYEQDTGILWWDYNGTASGGGLQIAQLVDSQIIDNTGDLRPELDIGDFVMASDYGFA